LLIFTLSFGASADCAGAFGAEGAAAAEDVASDAAASGADEGAGAAGAVAAGAAGAVAAGAAGADAVVALFSAPQPPAPKAMVVSMARSAARRMGVGLRNSDAELWFMVHIPVKGVSAAYARGA
jgi:hypothetical protein